MKKVLFIANSDRHIKLCHLPYMKMFQENGYIVHVATNTKEEILYCNKKIDLSLKRNPFSFSNIKAIFEIRQLVKQEKYDIISCHTPVGGFLGRISVIRQKLDTKVFYIAHGFHFYRGASLINWCLYYPIEKYLSRYTTCLLTMNEEDYRVAKKNFLCDIYKINGIGYDFNRLKINNYKLKSELNLENYFTVLYVAEISKRKRQLELVKELKKIDLEKEKIKVVLLGDSTIKNFSKHLNNNNIIYIDFKDNIGDYLNMCDLVISASSQEGLPISLMEAMHLNKMIIATNIRGNKDLIDLKNGILVKNMEDLVQEIIHYKNNQDFKVKNNINKYKIENVLKSVIRIYNKYLENKLK